MTGKELFNALAKMTPEQRSLDIRTQATDVGRYRATMYNCCGSIQIMELEIDVSEMECALDLDTETCLVIS